ncbi:MAG: hypothetical protein ACE5KX_06515 [Acidimicrobiia bacterium]
MGRRFAVIAYGVGLPVQVATGLALASNRGVTLGSLTRSGYGGLLGIKVVLVGVAVVLAVGHGVAAATGRDRTSRRLAMAALAASISIVFFAAALVP